MTNSEPRTAGPVRMLALVTDAYGANGGIAQYNRDFLSALASARNGIEIDVLARSGGGAAGIAPENIRILAPRRGRIAYGLSTLAVAFRDRYDVIFCGHLYKSPLAALLARVTGAQLWLQIHGIEAWQRPSLLHRWAAEQADLVTAVSRYTRREFLFWSRVEPWRVRVLPNTVDDRFSPGPKPQELVRRYGLEGRKVLLTVGRLSAQERYKGHDRVIQALPELVKTHPDIVYLIAGDGDDKGRLEALADACNVAQYVLFVGHVPEGALPDLYRLADVYVMPSTGEGFGIVFLEAAMTGVPVIAGDRDGAVDALADGELGSTVDPTDQQSLIDVVGAAFRKGQSTRNNVAKFGFVHFARQIQKLASATILEEVA